MSARSWIAGGAVVALGAVVAVGYSASRRQRVADAYEIAALTSAVDGECALLSGDVGATLTHVEKDPTSGGRLNGQGGLESGVVETWLAEYRACSAARFTSKAEAVDDAASLGHFADRLLTERGPDLAKTLRELEARVVALSQRPFRREALSP